MNIVVAEAFAIPANTPITNTATVNYQVAGQPYTLVDSEILITSAGSGNSVPSGVGLTNVSISENIPGGVIGSFTVVDSDPNDTHTYVVVDARFVVTGSALSLAPGVSLDFEVAAAIPVAVTVTDQSGAVLQQGIVVVVLDVNEAPIATLTNVTAVAVTQGAIIGPITVVDPDVGDVHSFVVDDARFEIVAGELKLRNDQALTLGSTVTVQVTVQDSGGLTDIVVVDVTGVPPGSGSGVNSNIAAYRLTPGLIGSQPVSVSVSQCLAVLGWQDDPILGQGVVLPDNLDLSPTQAIKSGEVIFLQVIDPDANLDGTLLDRVEVTLTTGTGDVETISIAETAVNTGLFVGYVQTEEDPPQVQDCVLQVGLDDLVVSDYVDANDPTDRATVEVQADPYSLVFDSATGSPINGAVVTLIDAATGNLAGVFADDGVTGVAARQVSGDPVYSLPDGKFRFPYVLSGDYLLQVTPPNRFRAPSTRSDAQLQSLPNGPFALNDGSRGQTFTLAPGPVLRVDIPLDLQSVAPSPSDITTAIVAPGSATTSVVQGQCFDGSSFGNAAQPVSLAYGALTLPGLVGLTAAQRFVRGDVVFIQLTDHDQDLDAFARDSVDVTVGVLNQTDQEVVRLFETNDSTGVFVGYLQTSADAMSVAHNCVLESGPASESIFTYVDPDDNQDQSSVSIALDPGFTVFSSASGESLDGAQVTLVDANTGLPATGKVFGQDGSSAFPATVRSGAQATDASGRVYDFVQGAFLFPVITPGIYRLQVNPTVSHIFPSTVDDTALNGLAQGPFVLQQGSRGLTFTVVAGQPVAFDIPLDPIAAQVFVSKQTSQEVVAIGDFLQYRVIVENADSAGIVSDLVVIDHLPPGFRLVSDSVRIAGRSPGAVQIDQNGDEVRVDIGALATGQQVELKYVVEITAGSKLGMARNSATVVGVGVASANTAFVDVLVQEDLMRSKATIVGQVWNGPCDETHTENGHGIADIRIWLEDGSFVVTDQQGKFHFSGVEPGTHVVQLDTGTLPDSYEVRGCEENSQFAGAIDSQFVDIHGGSLWRSDFYVNKKPATSAEVVTRLDAQANTETGRIAYEYRIIGGSVPLSRISATVVLDDQVAYVADSARLGGLKKGEPESHGDGMLVFQLPATQEAFEYTLGFAVQVKQPNGSIDTKAMVQMTNDTDRFRSKPVVNTLSLNWPSSLFEIAESDQPLPKVARANSAKNARALQRAQVANAKKLPKIDRANNAQVRINSQAYEPSRGRNYSRSNITRAQVISNVEVSDNFPYELPNIDRGEPPPFDRVWLQRHSGEIGIVWPPERYNPIMPAIAVAVVHANDERPQLMVDGKLVSSLTFAGTTKQHQLGVSVTRWDNVAISERDSVISAQLQNDQGVTLRSFTRAVHYSGRPVRAQLVANESYLLADGVFPPVVAVRLFDRSGYPLRAGTTGDFSVSPPYAPLDKTRHLENGKGELINHKYRVLRDGIAYIQLAPSIETGEVVVRFQFDQVRSEAIRARLVPGQQDWIMVGLLEGSLSQQNLSGNKLNMTAAGLTDNLLTDGRMAFYAKGMVRGQWLLTAAYDTDKKFAQQLREQIDPNQFYTLYGDGSQQFYAAQSQQKLYLKLEKSLFSALFGDFDTQFQRSELSRYERRMNGVDIGYFGAKVEAKVFAAQTDQAFVRDELRGDGTSGVYRLSRSSLVRNSESVQLVVRDRFALEKVVQQTTLVRYLDYTIDFDRGQLIFKQPIHGQDERFNPIFIEVEYEVVSDNRAKEVVLGSRLAYRLNSQDSEVALTYVHDDAALHGGDLLGVDVTWQINDKQKLTTEYSRTTTDLHGQAQGYLVEFEHRDRNLAGRVYARETQSGFGLGHQSTLEVGMQKFGLEGEYQLREHLLVRGQTFQQRLIDAGTRRVVADVSAQWQIGRSALRGGIRGVSEQVMNAPDRETGQILFGGSRQFLNNRLVLRGDAEIDVSAAADNTDYPSRGIVGVEYEVMTDLKLIVEQELTWGDERDTQDTRFGVKSRPWTGADISSTVTHQAGENGARLFATSGLLQQWRLNDEWLVDVGIDRVETLRDDGAASQSSGQPQTLSFNPNLPPASGSYMQDFSAFFGGVGYNTENWNVTGRLEFHAGDVADKWNFLVGANRQLAQGRVISSSLAYLTEERADGSVQNSTDFRLGLAWRSPDSHWTFLNRTDLVFSQRSNTEFDLRGRKWVNNFNANYKSSQRQQLSLQLGIKYVIDEIDEQQYDSTTLLYGFEYRFNVSPKWDVGAHTSVLVSLKSKVMDQSAGVSVGFNAVKNSWVSVGFNFFGFRDEDFVAADYTGQGPYLKVRMKIDQELAHRFLAFTGLAARRHSHANNR